MKYEEKLSKILKMDLEKNYKDFIDTFAQWNGKTSTSWSRENTIEFNLLVVGELARFHAIVEVLILELRKRNNLQDFMQEVVDRKMAKIIINNL